MFEIALTFTDLLLIEIKPMKESILRAEFQENRMSKWTFHRHNLSLDSFSSLPSTLNALHYKKLLSFIKNSTFQSLSLGIQCLNHAQGYGGLFVPKETNQMTSQIRKAILISYLFSLTARANQKLMLLQATLFEHHLLVKTNSSFCLLLFTLRQTI